MNLYKVVVFMSLAAALAMAQPSVMDTSYSTKTGERVLRLESDMPVSAAQAWRAFTTEEGLRQWIAPVVVLDFRIGGSISTNYDAKAKIGDRGTIRLPIVSYVENQLIILKVNLNDTFAKKARDEDRDLQEIVQFVDLGNGKTKLISSMVGWGAGKEWNDAYNFFARGNKWTYQQLSGYLARSTASQSVSSGPGSVADPVNLDERKTSDFSWMTGRWIGHLRDAPGVVAEQICSQPQNGEMICLFRLFAGGKPAMFELYTMQDTPGGPEMRSLHFATDLNEKAVQSPLVMRLTKYSAEEVVFTGLPGSEVVTSTLTRDSPQSMNGAIVLTDPKQGQIHVRWVKTDYSAPLQ